MMATSFWSPDGKPMSAAQFVDRLFGDIPVLFKDEAELRKLWSTPDTRRELINGLADLGYGGAQLDELRKIISAEKSGLYDVLAYIAFARAPMSREERVATHRDVMFEHYDSIQRDFLNFVLDQYVKQGVGERDQEKLPHLLELKYHEVAKPTCTLVGR